MNEDRDREDDPFRELWISNWEQQCVEQLESEPDYERQLQSERDLTNQKVWISFQNSATAVAQLYKESSEGIRRTSELGLLCGYQRRNKEILNWARKKRHHIRREDLLAYLAGRAAPPRPQHHRSSPKPRIMLSERHSSPHSLQMEANHDLHHHGSTEDGVNIDDDLHTFREALSVSNSPMSRRQRSSELSAFIASEFARHCKRPAPASPTHDVNMDSPTHKRSRLM
ncbi:UPF0472 protein C16orf72-like protein [Gryllus bimaculatus]|nr:UPF0472 protein C16orf72-like protein [Gryllus bimaculatus]